MSYVSTLSELGITFRENGIWLSVGAVEGAFGWKLHVSSVQAEAEAVLKAVIPALKRSGTPFKLARDEVILGELNEGTFGVTQVGKFMTIYPSSPERARSLADELATVTRGYPGPSIVSDLYVGGAVYARYGSFAPSYARNRLGQMEIVDPNGLAGYKVPFEPPPGIENPFEDIARGERRENRVGLALKERGILLLRPISVQPKGNVYLALSSDGKTAVDTVVIKTGRRHCMSDKHGRHMWDRLEHQFGLARDLEGNARVPRALDTFDRGENRFLVLEHIEGRDLNKTDSKRFDLRNDEERHRIVRDLIAVVESARALHAAGVVHRDLSPHNIVIAETGEAVLLDLEMSHRLGSDSTPFQSGTPGFVSPWQREGAPPAVADDVYSIGCLTAHMITGQDPRRLPIHVSDSGDLDHRLQSLSGAPRALVELCAQMLSSDSERLPSLESVSSRLAEIADDNLEFSQPNAPKAVGAELHDRLSRGLRWLLRGGLRDPSSDLPLSLEVEETHNSGAHSKAQSYRLYRSASRGVAGVVYAIARLEKLGVSDADSRAFVDTATDWLLAHENTPDDQLPGLHYGEAGVAVSLAEALSAGLIGPGEWVSPYMEEALNGSLDWPDLTHGAAGQLLAAHICAASLNQPSMALAADRCVDYLIAAQASDGAWRLPDGGGVAPGTAYTGFAHGTAGIVHALARHHSETGCHRALDSAIRGAQWLTSQTKHSTSGTACTWPVDPSQPETWHWWCHGGPGIAIAMLSLYSATGREEFADSARCALRGIPEEPSAPNLSQCHGLAGLGQICLTAHSVLGDAQWRDRAAVIASRLVALARDDSPDMCTWLVENPHQPTADLMIGTAGVLYFLASFADVTGSSAMPLDLPIIRKP